jgi:hypothetical protein
MVNWRSLIANLGRLSANRGRLIANWGRLIASWERLIVNWGFGWAELMRTISSPSTFHSSVILFWLSSSGAPVLATLLSLLRSGSPGYTTDLSRIQHLKFRRMKTLFRKNSVFRGRAIISSVDILMRQRYVISAVHICNIFLWQRQRTTILTSADCLQKERYIPLSFFPFQQHKQRNYFYILSTTKNLVSRLKSEGVAPVITRVVKLQ